ncbi:MAG: hypothetical protein K0U86_05920 [Planctomycetes bacterium]|nr:hypothetical protein [Planctomycetota bacterium]MCH9724425.1 hypothetical protein [Planctomycetota bacterium]MCH9776293.1 hypothetical protein [Planctomycetota bacterium]MCH9789488.1 hypothetical protein [Planctomycetota bacterium]
MAADLQFKLVISKNAPHYTGMRGVLHIHYQKGALLGNYCFNVRLCRAFAGCHRFYQGATTAAGTTGYSQTPDSTLEGKWKNRHFESH